MGSLEKIFIFGVCVFAGFVTYICSEAILKFSHPTIKEYDRRKDKIYKKFMKKLSKNGYFFIKHIPLTVRRVDSEFLLAFNRKKEICVFAIMYDDNVNLSAMCYILDKFSKEGNFAEKILYNYFDKRKIDTEYNEDIEKYNIQVWNKK